MEGRELEMTIRALFSILRIIITVICVRKARELNRSTLGWGIFGFFLPIIAIIWIQFVKPKTRWEEEN